MYTALMNQITLVGYEADQKLVTHNFMNPDQNDESDRIVSWKTPEVNGFV